MPRYMMLIVGSEEGVAPEDHVGGAGFTPGQPVFEEIAKMHYAFQESVKNAGATIVSSEALLPTSTATFLRNTRTPDVAAVDNPAPDLKETLGGYYLIDADDDSVARSLAEQCPSPAGYIELRPVFDFGADGM